MNKSVISFVFIICISTAANAQRPGAIKIIESTTENFTGGAPGSPQRYVYKIKVLSKHTAKVIFDTLWIVQAAIPLKAVSTNGDTVFLTGTYIRQDPEFLRRQGQPVPPDTVKTPKELAGEALLSYVIKKKRYFITIQKFKQTRTVPFPAAPPAPH